MMRLRSYLLVFAALGFALFGVTFLTGNQTIWQASLVSTTVLTAIGLGGVPAIAGYQFTAWIVAAVTAAMCYPNSFLLVGPLHFGSWYVPEIDLRNKWIILAIVQLVMFGMGTKMSLRDFAGVAKMPYPVFIGIALQFLVMPLTGWLLTKVFTFPPEIAAGVILIGSCSSGLASNVMCYIAGADLALSVTLTSVATLLAPVLTPFWMETLAGELVEIHFLDMMIEIFKIVLIPIGAALLHDLLNRTTDSVRMGLYTAATLAGMYLGLLVLGPQGVRSSINPDLLESTVLLSVAIVAGVVFHVAAINFSWVEKYIHIVSMFGIIYFTAVTTAAGRDNLLRVGLVLFLAAAIHNLVGWILGYWLSLIAGLDRKKALTVGFEVAMQNGGMASGIAGMMGKLGTVGLAAAVFSPWMNVSGSIIANLIRRYAPVQEEAAAE